MHIVFVSPYDHHGAPSGARRRVEALCEALGTACSVRVTCISPWTPPSCVEHVPFSFDGILASRPMRFAELTYRLASMQPDLVISESPLAPWFFRRYALLHVIHDAKFATAFSRRGAVLVRWVHWFSARVADKVVTGSYAERDRLSSALNIAPTQVMVSYNGLAEPWLSTPRPPDSKLRAYDLLYVSNFAPHKGHLRLLEILRGRSWRVAFVGSDFGERGLCMRKAAEWNVDATFLSNLSDNELIATYDDSRAFVFPSSLEGFGIPYLEARARGLPVLANDIPVFRELQGLVGGQIVDFADALNAGRSMERLVQEPLDSINLESFRWSVIAKDLLANVKVSL